MLFIAKTASTKENEVNDLDKLLRARCERYIDDRAGMIGTAHSFTSVIQYLDGCDVGDDVLAMLANYVDEIEGYVADCEAKIDAIETLIGFDISPDDQPVNVKSEATDPPTKARKATRKSLRAGLDDEALADIRKRAGEGESYVVLGAAYNVSRSTIGNIVQRKGCYA